MRHIADFVFQWLLCSILCLIVSIVLYASYRTSLYESYRGFWTEHLFDSFYFIVCVISHMFDGFLMDLLFDSFYCFVCVIWHVFVWVISWDFDGSFVRLFLLFRMIHIADIRKTIGLGYFIISGYIHFYGGGEGRTMSIQVGRSFIGPWKDKAVITGVCNSFW